jgi:hypothetical protein
MSHQLIAIFPCRFHSPKCTTTAGRAALGEIIDDVHAALR